MSKPFSNDFVIKETLRHMQECIAISTRKTIARLPEFQGDTEKMKELMSALSNLNRLDALIVAIRENNPNILGE